MLTFHLVKLAVLFLIPQIASLGFQGVSFLLVELPGNHVALSIPLHFCNFCVLIYKLGLRIFTMQGCNGEYMDTNVLCHL